MKVRILLFGALRDAGSNGFVELDVPEGCSIAELRNHLLTYLDAHAPTLSTELVRRSAFATAETIVHDHQPVPANAELAVLPPVGGG